MIRLALSLAKCVLLGVATLAGTNSAQAGPCDIVPPTSQVVRAPSGGGFYDVFATTPSEVYFDIHVRNDTSAEETCFVFFETSSGEGAMRGGAEPDMMAFSLFAPPARNDLILPTGSASKSPRLRFVLPGGQTKRRRVRLVVDAGQFVSPGGYRGQVTVKSTLSGSSGLSLSEAQISFQSRVEPQGSIYISVLGNANTSSGKTAFFDFGNLTEDEPTANINFLIQSNGNYRYHVESQNAGRLQLRNPPADLGTFEDFIAYNVRSNGAEVALDGTAFPVGSTFRSTRRSGDQQVFAIELERGPQRRPGNFIEGKLAGRYEDTLRFTIVAE